MFSRSTFHNLAQIRSPNCGWKSEARLAATLIPSTPETPAMQGLAFCRFFLTAGRVRKVIRPLVALAQWTLIDVDTLKVHFEHGNGGVSAKR